MVAKQMYLLLSKVGTLCGNILYDNGGFFKIDNL
jgi:hypothetical protein